MRQVIGPLVQFLVGQLLLRKADGDCGGRTFGLLFDHFVHATEPIIDCGVVPGGKLLAFFAGQQRYRADMLPRIRAHAAQHLL